MKKTDGVAIVYCEGAFNTPNGKTAHGLVRFTHRYQVVTVIDSRYQGQDAGEVLDGKPNGILIAENFENALAHVIASGLAPTHLVIGLAPDGGRIGPEGKTVILKAIQAGLNIVSGLHDFLSEDEKLAKAAATAKVTIKDVRKPPHRDQLHFFSGKIEEVSALKIAVLGTDSAVGKRTTAWLVVHALEKAGIPTEMVGTGQTGWMQGARYSLILDSLVNDFVSGEIEHAVWSAWKKGGAEVVVIEGQGSLMNPAYPGGFEILAAGRPDFVILQHAPARKDYDGFPGYPMHSLKRQIEAIQMLSDRPVKAITLNHEDIAPEDIDRVCQQLSEETGLPVFDVLKNGAEDLAELVKAEMKVKK